MISKYMIDLFLADLFINMIKIEERQWAQVFMNPILTP